MGTIVLYAVIAVAFAAALVALFVIVLPDDVLSRPVRDVVPLGLPADDELDGEDVNRLRLPVTVRGYRMVDTDAVLDRLGAELDRRDREIAQLRSAYDQAVAGEQTQTFGAAAAPGRENASPVFGGPPDPLRPSAVEVAAPPAVEAAPPPHDVPSPPTPSPRP